MSQISAQHAQHGTFPVSPQPPAHRHARARRQNTRSPQAPHAACVTTAIYTDPPRQAEHNASSLLCHLVPSTPLSLPLSLAPQGEPSHHAPNKLAVVYIARCALPLCTPSSIRAAVARRRALHAARAPLHAASPSLLHERQSNRLFQHRVLSIATRVRPRQRCSRGRKRGGFALRRRLTRPRHGLSLRHVGPRPRF